jgi:hypothetical protein
MKFVFSRPTCSRNNDGHVAMLFERVAYTCTQNWKIQIITVNFLLDGLSFKDTLQTEKCCIYFKGVYNIHHPSSPIQALEVLEKFKTQPTMYSTNAQDLGWDYTYSFIPWPSQCPGWVTKLNSIQILQEWSYLFNNKWYLGLMKSQSIPTFCCTFWRSLRRSVNDKDSISSRFNVLNVPISTTVPIDAKTQVW